jgi:hypothetical protein
MEATIMLVWTMILILATAQGDTEIHKGSDYRTEAACSKALKEVTDALPEGKPVMVGCMAIRVKSA